MAELPLDLRRRVLDWVYTLFTHHTNETQAILRAATATGYGLDPSKYVSTVPGSTVNIITPPSPVAVSAETAPSGAAPPPPASTTLPPPPLTPTALPVKGWSGWAQAAGAAALTAAGAGAGWGLGALTRGPGAPAVAPPAQTTPAETQWQLKLPDAAP